MVRKTSDIFNAQFEDLEWFVKRNAELEAELEKYASPSEVIEHLRNERNEWSRKYKKAESALADLQLSATKLQGELMRKDDEIARLRDEVAELKADIDLLLRDALEVSDE